MKDKKGCLYGCLTAIGILLVLLVLLGSCSAYFSSSNDSDNSSETITEDEKTIEAETKENSTDELTVNSMSEISQYFIELSDYAFNAENKDSETSIEELTDLQNRISKTVDNIRTIPLSKLQQYLINTAMYQNSMCTQLISYEKTGDQSYLNTALELMAKANQEVQEMNEYVSNEY